MRPYGEHDERRCFLQKIQYPLQQCRQAENPSLTNITLANLCCRLIYPALAELSIH